MLRAPRMPKRQESPSCFIQTSKYFFFFSVLPLSYFTSSQCYQGNNFPVALPFISYYAQQLRDGQSSLYNVHTVQNKAHCTLLFIFIFQAQATIPSSRPSIQRFISLNKVPPPPSSPPHWLTDWLMDATNRQENCQCLPDWDIWVVPLVTPPPPLPLMGNRICLGTCYTKEKKGKKNRRIDERPSWNFGIYISACSWWNKLYAIVWQLQSVSYFQVCLTFFSKAGNFFREFHIFWAFKVWLWPWLSELQKSQNLKNSRLHPVLILEPGIFWEKTF